MSRFFKRRRFPLRSASFGLALLLALGSLPWTAQPSLGQSSTKFYCAQLDGVWRTFMEKRQRRAILINWVSAHFDETQWDRRSRCITVANRFQSFLNAGTLKWAKAGTKNNYPVVCVPYAKEASCQNSPVLFTLEPGQSAADAESLLESIASGSGRGNQQLNLSTGLMSRDGNGELLLDLESLLRDWENGVVDTIPSTSSPEVTLPEAEDTEDESWFEME